MRDEPPEGLRRTPGPEAILYYLPRDQELQAAGVPLPRSSCTVYRILKKHGRIQERRPRKPEPQERNAPMTVWQADFKDVTTVPAEPDGKRLHGVQTLNVLDSGTSALLDAQVRADFTAEVAMEAFVEPRLWYGCPAGVVVDRDARLSSAVQQAVISRPPSCAFVPAWASRRTSAPRITPKKMGLSRGTTEPINRSAWRGSGRPRWSKLGR